MVKSVKMGCEISSERPVEAEVKLQITGSQIEVKRFVTTTTDSCQDNCDVCVEAEAKAKLAKAEARRISKRREYRARKKQRQREEKNARREIQERSANLQVHLAAPLMVWGAQTVASLREILTKHNLLSLITPMKLNHMSPATHLAENSRRILLR